MSSIVDYIISFIEVFIDVVFQRFKLWACPAIEDVKDTALLSPAARIHVPSPGHDISGLNVIVTGPTAGIGLETAAELYRRGANVFLACRSKDRGEKARQLILSRGYFPGADGVRTRSKTKTPTLEVVLLDLASLASVRAFLSDWAARGTPVHVLVNNAGVFDMAGPRSETEDGFESHLGTNYLASYLLTLGLVPFLRAAARAAPAYGARIVHVSSKLNELGQLNAADMNLKAPGGYSPLKGYGQSKLAQIMFSAELSERLPSSWRVSTLSVHPGNVLSDVTRGLPWYIRKAQDVLMKAILLTTREGARASVFCVVDKDIVGEARRTHGHVDSSCRPSAPNPAVDDERLLDWLWRFSADAVKLPPALDIEPVQ